MDNRCLFQTPAHPAEYTNQCEIKTWWFAAVSNCRETWHWQSAGTNLTSGSGGGGGGGGGGLKLTQWVPPAADQLHHHLITSSPTGTGETSKRLLMIGPVHWLYWPQHSPKTPFVKMWTVELLWKSKDLTLSCHLPFFPCFCYCLSGLHLSLSVIIQQNCKERSVSS